MHDFIDTNDMVNLHVKVSARARKALKVAAAARGLTVGELVEHWATAEADAADFVDRMARAAK